MGLDITAYRRLRAIRPDGKDEAGRDDWSTTARFYDNPDFPGRAEGVDCDSIHEYEEEFGFRAGSYSGYNGWRAWLAGLANDGAFHELVWFSDCEGTIGPVVAAKLARDFAANDDAAKARGDDYEYSKYREWRKAFEMAADGGAVSFH